MAVKKTAANTGKKIVARRPGQTLVVPATMTTKQSQDPGSKGWIIDDKTKIGRPVGVQQAIKQGYWDSASGPAPTGVTYKGEEA